MHFIDSLEIGRIFKIQKDESIRVSQRVEEKRNENNIYISSKAAFSIPLRNHIVSVLFAVGSSALQILSLKG